MNSERWQRVKQILDEAILVNPQERSAYLKSACSDDQEFRQEVESLLEAHDQAGTTFLKDPAVNLKSLPPSFTSRAGLRLGVYLVVEEIGRGGMGEVYRAVRADGQYTKEVAVKLVRGGFDGASVLERFRNERQILASLDHPNIGRLLDGGTTEDGVPYLVMELIEGKPIDQYCDERRLSITKRLQLFQQVCGAVHYAHQRLVVHRDIKPSNIMVTKEGVPKLLDFGIAKIVSPIHDAQTTLTQAMTPEYASPEQIRGEPITTATDVYSLGVVLYRLLTGRSPYVTEARSQHELARAVCETEAGRPSAAVLKPETPAHKRASHMEQISSAREGSPARLQRRLAGDLDDILLMALRKEPTRRYGSVEQFSEDIRRHLAGRPVAASKGSWSYRAEKFIQRHKVGMIAALVVILAIAGGIGATIREAHIAKANAGRAERRFNDVRKLANALMFEIDDSIKDLPGATPARKLLVTRASEYLDSLSQEAKGDASLEKELARAYERVGDVLGSPYHANLGDLPGALESYQKALAIRERLTAAQPSDTEFSGELVGNHIRVANVLENSGDLPGALNSLQKALSIAKTIPFDAANPTQADRLAGTWYYIAELLVKTGDTDRAFDAYQQAKSFRTAALEANSRNISLRTHLAADDIGLAKLMQRKGDPEQASETQGKAIEILTQLANENPNNATLREFLAEAINHSSVFQREKGAPDAALESARRAHQIFSALVEADPKNTLAKANFGFSDIDIASALILLGRPSEAIPVFQEAVLTFQDMSPSTSRSRYIRTGLAEAYSGLGDAQAALAKQHRSASERRQYWRVARSWYDKSLSVWSEKRTRGELEDDERSEPQTIQAALARCEANLANPTTRKQ
jgi:serine/threonine protein kinase/tetratricopeptide (TPR) repeat protein